MKALPSLLLASALYAPSAHAHIDMLGDLLDRGGDQKAGPCGGVEWGTGTVYTFEPGAVIKLELSESLPHDGYFRIAFDDEGDDGFVDPKSIDPVNPNRYGTGKKCSDDPADRCGESDFCSFVSNGKGPTVLWDNLDPHLSEGVKTRSWNVKLPDIECEQCTVQVIQVMEDPADLGIVQLHGPFDGMNDLYYRCIDVKLERGATASKGTTSDPVKNKGMLCAAAMEPGTPDMADASVSLPDAEVASSDSGTTTEPMPRDAGEPDEGDEDDASSDEPTGARSPDAGTKRDAGKALDADSGEDEDKDEGGDEAPAANSSSGGCNVADAAAQPRLPSLFGVLTLLALLARRRAARRMQPR